MGKQTVKSKLSISCISKSYLAKVRVNPLSSWVSSCGVECAPLALRVLWGRLIPAGHQAVQVSRRGHCYCLINGDPKPFM